MLDFIMDFSKQFFGGYQGDRVIKEGIRALDHKAEHAQRRALGEQIGKQEFKLGGPAMTYDDMVLFCPDRADAIEAHMEAISEGASNKVRAMRQRRQELLMG